MNRLDVCAVSETEAGILELFKAPDWQLPSQEFLPEQHPIVWNVSLASCGE